MAFQYPRIQPERTHLYALPIDLRWRLANLRVLNTKSASNPVVQTAHTEVPHEYPILENGEFSTRLALSVDEYFLNMHRMCSKLQENRPAVNFTVSKGQEKVKMSQTMKQEAQICSQKLAQKGDKSF